MIKYTKEWVTEWDREKRWKRYGGSILFALWLSGHTIRNYWWVGVFLGIHLYFINQFIVTDNYLFLIVGLGVLFAVGGVIKHGQRYGIVG